MQDKFKQLWADAHPAAMRYVKLWPSEDDETLQAMLADGVTIDAERGINENGYAYLVTTDPIIARKYDMHDEREFA